jgi:hypothetical protein
LYFETDPILAKWEDGSYDADGNLKTNCDPNVSWSIEAGEATINDYGLVTFGASGEWAGIEASCNPEDSFALAILKIRLFD